MATSNERLQNYSIRHQIELQQYILFLQNRILEMLDTSDEYIRGILYEGLKDLTGIDKANNVINKIIIARDRTWSEIVSYLEENLETFPEQEARQLIEFLEDIVPVEWKPLIPTLPATNEQRQQGATITEWVDSAQGYDGRIIAAAIIAGLAAADPRADVIRRLTGTSSLGYSDGQLATTKRNITNIIRTVVSGFSAGAKYEAIKENSDVISQEKFMAVLDAATTAVCQANDGKVFDANKGPVPPLHISCRSTRVPILSDEALSDRPANAATEKILFQEFVEGNDIEEIGSVRHLSATEQKRYQRYSKERIKELVGPVPASETYSSWLKKQSNQFQNEILGPTRAEAFRSGKFNLDEFVNYTGRELTLKELGLK